MSQNSETVVIAVDNSKYSEEAVNWYIGHMHKPGNKVLMVHCIEMPSVPSRDTWEAQTKAGREKAKAIEDKFVSKLQEIQADVEFVMDFEKPGEHVVDVAKKNKADVIVMGTRGISKVKRVFLGSVSNYVLNHAHCPVLVVRPPNEKDD